MVIESCEGDGVAWSRSTEIQGIRAFWTRSRKYGNVSYRIEFLKIVSSASNFLHVCDLWYQ